jgi:ribonuclease P protein component
MFRVNTEYLSFRPDDRLGKIVIIIGKKVIKLAVYRNKLKRRLREILRVHNVKYCSGIIYAKKGIEKLTYKELEKEILSLIKST